MSRRAIVCYVDAHEHLIQQLLALRLSCLHSGVVETDLVVFGPAEVLVGLPDDLVTIPQRPASDDPVWHGYRFINSITCLNGAGSERLEQYTHLLRTDVDTFLTPSWNRFRPEVFTTGHGAYSNGDDVRQRIVALAADYGLNHHGLTNVGATWYGATDVVRRAAALSEMICRDLLNGQFREDEGKWPGWFRGVASMYAGEIAVNHLAPDAERSRLLDAPSTGNASPSSVVHIHCWHTDTPFSKHWFMNHRYPPESVATLNPDETADYCLALSFQSLVGLETWKVAQQEAKANSALSGL